jgi:hypothetical protein
VLIAAPPGFAPLLDRAYSSFQVLLDNDGHLFGVAETPIGAELEDPKRYLEFGSEACADVPVALRELREELCSIVDEHLTEIEAEFFSGHGGLLTTLLDRERGPVLRLSWYPAGRTGEVNQPHTDIDLFTVLPAATRSGLEVKRSDGWSRYEPSSSELLVLPGDLLKVFGGAQAAEHRVITDGHERMSVSLFVNAEPSIPIARYGTVGQMFEARLATVQKATPRR